MRVDEPSNALYYMARDGDNYMKFQLHRVGLDGTDDKRLTDPAFNHTVSLAPDGSTSWTSPRRTTSPPVTRLVDANGKVDRRARDAPTSRKFNELGLKKVEMYTYPTSDGKATLHGMIQLSRRTFDPSKKYPVLVSVYGGPGVGNSTQRALRRAERAHRVRASSCFNVEARTNPGMGRKYLDAVYLKLGQVEIDDMADGVKALWSRPYIDKNRVGIFGTSYGGYTSVMEMLRHPEVFAAASSSSPPTDWRNYDTIYTERYMWIPQENHGRLRQGLGDDVRRTTCAGRLMLYFGTADNNVHPSNMMQLISALQRAGKSFDLQLGPDQGHSGLNPQRMMEFFIENLVIAPPGPKAH